MTTITKLLAFSMMLFFPPVAVATQAIDSSQCQVTITVVEKPDRPEGSIAGAGGPLQINATFDPNVTQAQRVVIQHAINEWTGLIQASGLTPNPYPVSFRNGLAPGDDALARASVTSTAAGDLVSASIGFSTNFTWFVDPTPGDDSEFSDGGPAGFDLLSVARHELGHALGFIDTRRVLDLMVGSAFNPPRMNIALVGNQHTDPNWLANDVMVPAIGPSTRRAISLYPAASLVARAYEYRIPMQYVDPMHTGAQTGTAVQPWRTMQTACVSSPSGMPLLLSNSTHLVPAGFRCASRRVVSAARGGAVVRP